MRTSFAATISFALLTGSQALAQVPTPVTNTDFSKETENPVTRQITLPLRYQADFLDGANKLTKSIFELDQAVMAGLSAHRPRSRRTGSPTATNGRCRSAAASARWFGSGNSRSS
jgi:hypothetical protein